MEFKISDLLPVAGTTGNFGAFLVIAGMFLMLTCGDRDGVYPTWYRAVLTLAVNCITAGLAAVARRSTRSRRRG